MLMKTKYVVFTFLLVASVAFANPVKIPGTDVTFLPPPGFQPLSQEIIDVKWPNKNAPRYVIGNATASTTIAYDIKDSKMTLADLAEAKGYFTTLFDRIIPGIEWKRNEIIEHSNQPWIMMEMTSNAIDTNIHNVMLVTSYAGRMLMFNFNSTKEDFPKYEKALRGSISSIKLPN